MKFGVGKSYSAMRIGELLDADYRNGTDALVKIVHTPEDFLKAMQYIEKKGKKGQVMIIDEAGLLVNARQWYSMINKAMSDVVMTFRVLKCMAIFIAPSLSVIDKNIRMFTNVWGRSEKIIKTGKTKVRLNVSQLMWDDKKWNEFYPKGITMYVKETQRITYFKSFLVDFPHNKELVDAYEEKAATYKRMVREDMVKLAGEATKEEINWIDKVLATPDLIHEKNGKQKVYPEELKEEFALTKNKAAIVARRVNEKLKELESPENDV